MTVDSRDQIKRYFEQSQQLFGNEIYRTNEPAAEVYQSTVDSLDEFRLQIQECKRCSLAATRTNFVFGAGDPNADLVCVGEAPGADEDAQGVPFVGRAGKLLDKILAAIDISREHNVFICNVLKCRPPQNRDPLAEEVLQCEPHLIRQLELIKPKLIVALGRVAAKTLLKIEGNVALKDLRNKIHDYHGTPLIATYHPAALLRSSRFKQPTWEDFKWIKKILNSES